MAGKSEEPKDVSRSNLERRLENLTIEQCALKCDELAANALDWARKDIYENCAREIRKLKKQED